MKDWTPDDGEDGKIVSLEEKRKRRKAPTPGIERANLLNVRELLEADTLLAGLVSYDEFAGRIVLERPIPRPGYPKEADWKPRPLVETDATALAQLLIGRGYKTAFSRLVLEVLAELALVRSKHPVRTYLRGLKWDRQQRLSRWLAAYAGAVVEAGEETVYLEAISRAALIGAVARIFEPGCKHDHVLVLIGLQGLGKSTLLRELTPDPAWFSDSLTHDMGSKDAQASLAGLWIVEMAELASLTKTDFADAKAFLSRQVDRFRPAYGRLEVERPRQVAFFATTNKDEPLKDDTGNRRFWPVSCGAADPVGLASNRDQIWAEAVFAYQNRERWWLLPELEILARQEQAKRMTEPALLDRVSDDLPPYPATVSIPEILRKWSVPERDWDSLTIKIAKVLRHLGYVSRWTRAGGFGKPSRRWFPPDDK